MGTEKNLDKRKYCTNRILKNCTYSVVVRIIMFFFSFLVEILIIRCGLGRMVSKYPFIQGIMIANIVYLSISAAIYRIYYTTKCFMIMIVTKRIRFFHMVAHIIFIATYIIDIYIICNVQKYLDIVL